MTLERRLATLGVPVFDSPELMYAHRGGAHSPETDFGAHWYFAGDGSFGWPKWRVSHNDTGFVYAVRLTPQDAFTLILVDHVDARQVESALFGWAEQPESESTIQSAFGRLRLLRQQESVAPRFETSVSPLATSNDGRVRMRHVSDESSSRTKVISVDGQDVWSTHSQDIVDAFIAGWDAHSDTDRQGREA